MLQRHLASFSGGKLPQQLLQSSQISRRRHHAYGLEPSELHSSPGELPEALVADLGRTDFTRGSLSIVVGVVAGFVRFPRVALLSANPCIHANRRTVAALQDCILAIGAALQAVKQAVQHCAAWSFQHQAARQAVQH